MRALQPVDLQSILDSNLLWRRRELTSLINAIQTADVGTKNALIRATVPILYAHWEGFGRECIVRYLEHVSYRRLKYKTLKPSFLYLACISDFSKSNQSVENGIRTLRVISDRREATNKDAFKTKISTRSNLRSEILVELLQSAGLDYTVFAPFHKFIDDQLCDARNAIAHGDGGSLPFDLLVQRRDQAVSLMVMLQTLVVNASIGQLYKA